jgi:hypothetical protein
MRRVALVWLVLAAGAVGIAQAQGLTMQMSNGWSFTFSGNVNAFLYYEKNNADGTTTSPGGIVLPGGTVNATRITTGLLPAFAVFDAKGKEGNTDLGVHFGFAPQVNCATGVNDCFGAQIDMRQVYLTIGGTWGQLLIGRELGLFSRQNILTDQTLFGVGASGNGFAPGTGTEGVGTTLGRIGFGYIYPNFRAQVTYSTLAGRPYQLSVGLFEAASVNGGNGPYANTRTPRLEAELTYGRSGIKGWLGGTLQNTKTAPSGSTDGLTAWGLSGGVRYERAAFSLTGSGYYGKGIGTTFFGSEGSCSITTGGGQELICSGGGDDARKSYGFIAQATFTPSQSKLTLAGSYGSSYLKASNAEKAATADFRTENSLVSAGAYYQATKSLKLVAEFDYWWTKGKINGMTPTGLVKNTQWAPAVGAMLFF